jgi:hypothetical protein
MQIGRSNPTALVEAALRVSATEQEKRARLWRMSSAQRVAAFYRGELSLADCLAWASRYPKEPPLAADGEFLFIAVRTPEWADATSTSGRARPQRSDLGR